LGDQVAGKFGLRLLGRHHPAQIIPLGDRIIDPVTSAGRRNVNNQLQAGLPNSAILSVTDGLFFCRGEPANPSRQPEGLSGRCFELCKVTLTKIVELARQKGQYQIAIGCGIDADIKAVHHQRILARQVLLQPASLQLLAGVGGRRASAAWVRYHSVMALKAMPCSSAGI
jgi:hypothetical protein